MTFFIKMVWKKIASDTTIQGQWDKISDQKCKYTSEEMQFSIKFRYTVNFWLSDECFTRWNENFVSHATK